MHKKSITKGNALPKLGLGISFALQHGISL